MHNAEKMIRESITQMTKYRCAYVKNDIEHDIKYAFWHCFIDEYIYIELLETVRNKYNSLFE